jgi:MATE family multidrug resistance protein
MMAAVMLLWPGEIVAFFLDEAGDAHREVAGYAVTLLMLAALFQVFDAGQVVGIGCLRGLKDTRIPMLYAVVSYWFVGLSSSAWLAFGLGLGGVGIWIGLIIALAVAAGLLISRFIRLQMLLMDRSAPIGSEKAPA